MTHRTFTPFRGRVLDAEEAFEEHSRRYSDMRDGTVERLEAKLAALTQCVARMSAYLTNEQVEAVLDHNFTVTTVEE